VIAPGDLRHFCALEIVPNAGGLASSVVVDLYAVAVDCLVIGRVPKRDCAAALANARFAIGSVVLTMG
jgi:hypothetical protein